jgi:OOP family OmpA-OmpF porin
MKKILCSSIALLCLQNSLFSETINFDLTLKTGLTAINNDDGSNFNKGTFAIDGVADLGYAVRPRIDFSYINIDEKAGSVDSLWQIAFGGHYELEVSDEYYVNPYMFAGIGFEYVNGSRKGFENQFFGEAGAGLKFPVNQNFSLVTEFKAIRIFDKNRNDEKDEFTLLIGVSMPFHVEKEIPDEDQDGVLNADDLCPNTPLGTKVDLNGCPVTVKKVRKVAPKKAPEKIVVIDSDKDGVVDNVDKCPNTPKGFIVNKSGCGVKKRLEVHFKTNSSELTPGSVQVIRDFAKYLERMPHVTVTIEGYTDSSGYLKKNMLLSQRRANAVKKALISLGISGHRIKAVGKGPLNPIANNETKEGRALNRRIEAIIHQ